MIAAPRKQPLPIEVKATGRIVELDGLRGLAILLVMSFHYLNNQLTNSINKWGKILAKVTSFGWVGVDLFFVLSGFLIGSILIRNKGSKNYFSSFYIRRLARIVPNYYLMLIIFLWIGIIPAFANNYFLTGNNAIPLWSYFAMVHNFYMAHMANLGTDAMSVTWSIGIEEQFYLIFPILVYFFRDQWLPWVLLIAIISASILRAGYQSWIPPYVLLYCRMDAISFGALVAWVNIRYDLKSLVKKYFLLLLGVIAIDIAVCGYLFIRFNDLGIAKNTMFAMMFAILILFALTFTDSWYGKLLRNKMLVWVGVISYSLYLFHYLMLGLIQHLFGNSNGIGIYHSKDILVSTVALILSVAFSWLVFKLLETPMVNWGKNFKY